MKFPLIFEATTSRAEFVRLLPAATGSEAIETTPDGFAGEGWRLSLIPMAPLVIGSVRLERHRVELQFEAWSESQQDAFMRRFTHHYQRGGG
jgi:hypothetical protein